MAIEFGLGFALALLLNRVVRLGGLARTLLVVPIMVAPTVSALQWRWILDPDNGILNYVGMRLGMPWAPQLWLIQPQAAFWTLVLVDVWQTTPFVLLFLLAGLQSLPVDPYEAARVDGASGWQIFLRLTLPLLRPVILSVLLLRFMDAFRIFDIAYVLTRGGPAYATDMISLYTYRVGLQWFDIGKASASAALTLFIIGACAAVLLLGLGRRQEERALMGKRGERLGMAAVWLLLALAILYTLFPIVWLILTSLKTPRDIFALPPKIIFTPTLENYRYNFQQNDFGLYFFNSVVISISAMVISLVVGSLAAYGFLRFHFRGGATLFFLALATRMAPHVALIVPLFVMLQRRRASPTRRVGLILVYGALNVPLVMWIMSGFLEELPWELEDAARIDGCSYFGRAVARRSCPWRGQGWQRWRSLRLSPTGTSFLWRWC